MIAKKYVEQLYKYFYIVLFLGYVIFVKVPEIRIGVICSLLTLLIGVQFFKCRVSKMGIIVVILMLWTVLSIVFVDPSQTPYTVSLRELTNVVFPMFFFFVGEKYTKKEGEHDFYDLLLIAILICFFSGLFWYICEPEYYLSYLKRIGYTSSWDNYHMDHRFCSFLGSIGIGLIGNCGLIIAFSRWCTEHKKKYLIETVCMYIMIILSMQRAAYVIMLLTTIYIIWKNKVYKHSIFRLIVAIVLIGCVVGGIKEYEIIGGNTLQVVERIANINFEDLLVPRFKIWKPIFASGIRLITGLGIGSCGIGGEIPVTDGGIVKVLGETGIIGILLWLIIIIVALHKIFQLKRGKKKSTIPFLIIVAFGMNSIGSNCIVFMEMAPILWFSIGIINSEYCIEKGIN